MVEQKVFFPKINEAILKRLKQQEGLHMKQQIIKKLNANSIHSLYSICDEHQKPQKKIQYKKSRHLSQFRKIRQKNKVVDKLDKLVYGSFFKQIQQGQSCMNREESSLNEILSNRRLQFNSTPVKKVRDSTKHKLYLFYPQQQIKCGNRKCQTEQTALDTPQDYQLDHFQSLKPPCKRNALTYKRLKLHDYRQLNLQRLQIMYQRQRDNKNLPDNKKVKPTTVNLMKITSGWNINQEDLDDL